MSQFSTKRDEYGMLVHYGKGAMRLRREQKRKEAEERNAKGRAILAREAARLREATNARRQAEAAVESDVVKKTRRGKR